MILEEHINKFKEAFIFCSNEEAEINIAMKGYQIEDLIHYLEELKELRVELEANHKKFVV